MNSDRIKQAATQRLFKSVSRYATNVPIIIVATKSDDFMAIKVHQARRLYADSGLGAEDFWRLADEYSKDQIRNRLNEIESELLKIPDGRFDGCVAVNQGTSRRFCSIQSLLTDADDADQIQHLSQITWKSFNHEKLRLMYIAVQTTNIDLKIDLSIMETMRVYRNVIGIASSLGLIPGASWTNRTAAAYMICKVIVKSFGLPTLDHQTVFEIVKANVWDDLGHNVSVAFAEGIATLGVAASVVLCGMPVFLASGPLNLPLVVPATTRLMLMLAGDLIIILTRAFKTTTFTCVGQPQFADVRQAAVHYGSFSSQVHKKILALVPRRKLTESYRYNKVEEGLRNIVYEYKNYAAEDIDGNVPSRIGVHPNTQRQQDDFMEVESEIAADAKDILPSYEDVKNKAQSDGFQDILDDVKNKAQANGFQDILEKNDSSLS